MRLGIHSTPWMSPARGGDEVFNWLVDQAVDAERVGMDEFWVGQHHSVAWEAVPTPELVIAAALRETSRITLAVGGHQLPYYHPASLASQAAWLSHIAKGRYILGCASGVQPGDSDFHGIESMDRHVERCAESLDIMAKFFSGEGFEYRGKFWDAKFPKEDWDRFPPAGETGGHKLRDLRPYGGNLPIAFTGGSARSTSLSLAGSKGLIPLTFAHSAEVLRLQWGTYMESAREAGLADQVSTDMRRVVWDVFVADTDEEAIREVTNGPIGQPLRAHRNERAARILMTRTDQGTSEVDMEDLLASGRMIAGSPQTVAAKVNEVYEQSGGWGTMLIYGYDYIDNPEPWKHSMELLVSEVKPLLNG